MKTLAPVLAAIAAGSAGPHAAHGPERTAILEAARPQAEQSVGKPVRFEVKRLKVEGRWAFLMAGMQDGHGRPISYAGTERAEAEAHHVISKDYVALLSHSDGGWSVVAAVVGPTDVAWSDWPQTYGAPAEVVGP